MVWNRETTLEYKFSYIHIHVRETKDGNEVSCTDIRRFGLLTDLHSLGSPALSQQILQKIYASGQQIEFT